MGPDTGTDEAAAVAGIDVGVGAETFVAGSGASRLVSQADSIPATWRSAALATYGIFVISVVESP